jgi:RNA methyltransferase, TrmH family
MEKMKKELLDLLKDKKTLKQEHLFIVDTEKILEEVIASGFEIKHFLYNEKGLEIFNGFKDTLSPVAERVKTGYIDKYAEVKSHQGFIAVVKASGGEMDENITGAVVLLDNIQDPANLGAIIRSGAAFGFKNYLLSNCAYIYSEKTIRASAGAVFLIKHREAGIEDVKKLKNRFKIVVTDVEKGIDVKEVIKQIKGDYILALGSEGRGISKEIMDLADYRVNISLPEKKVESLNVGVAAGIIFYNFAESRKI